MATKFRVLAISIALVLSSLTSSLVSAQAASCPATNLDGKTVANIAMGKTKVEVKRVDYPKSGVLDPPKSPQFAGVSIRHQPLSSIQGSSLIVWHVSYHGCRGKLNVVSEAPVKTKFSVTDEKGIKTDYRIIKNITIPVGNYDADWFRLNGPRQLVFVTCAGKVVNGHHTKNQVVVAVPA